MHLKDRGLLREQCYLGGNWANADSGETFEVFNPADGTRLGLVPKMGAAETRRAIEAAGAAYPAWRALTAKREVSHCGGGMN